MAALQVMAQRLMLKINPLWLKLQPKIMAEATKTFEVLKGKLPPEVPETANTMVSKAIPWWPVIKSELAPPRPSSWPIVKTDAKKLAKSALEFKFLDVTVTEAIANGFVLVDIFLWFCAGEVLGRGCLRGYDVSDVPIPAPP